MAGIRYWFRDVGNKQLFRATLYEPDGISKWSAIGSRWTLARRLRWTGQQYDTPETRKRRGIWCIMAGAHWFSAVKGIDQSGAARASKPGNMNYEEWKAGKAQKNVDNSTNSGKIRIDTQFFANRGIAKRTGKQLYKSISSWAENIKEHEEKLNNPEKYDKDWNAKKEKKWRKIKAAFMKCKS